MVRNRRSLRRQRRGNIIVLTAVLMVFLMAVLAFAIDIGYLVTAKNELQRAADASALAGAWELLDESAPSGAASAATLRGESVTVAARYAGYNAVTSEAPALDTSDTEVGYIADPLNPASPMITDSAMLPNALRVRVQKTSLQNGEVPMFFGKVLGKDSAASQAEATAALINNFGGFRISSGGGNLELLPFALDVDTWNNLLAGGGSDNYNYNPATGEVSAGGGGDGVREVNLYPQGTGSPGNRGTVDIGGSNNSTNDIARQIVHGISEDDMNDPAMAHFNGELKFDSNGELELNGDTGISAGIKDELTSIIGEPRIIPIFSSVVGPGNNAQYTIVKFAGVRILDVKLTGSMSSKKVIIQPATIKVRGGIPSSNPGSSHFIYSPVWLVR